MPRKPKDSPEDDEGSVSLGVMNVRLRDMANRALDAAGGDAYLLQIARKNPNAFLRFLSQFVQNDTAVNAAGLNIIVQTINIGSAGPVPGVLASPIAAHVSLVPHSPPPGGEVIDMPGGSDGP